MTSDRVEHELIEPAAASAFEPANRRRLVGWLLLTAVLLILGVVLFLVLDARGRAREEALARSVTALAQQVQDMGGTPVVAPPGLPGADGLPGRDGRDGVDGRNGVDGRDGTTPPCLSEPPQCRGADGTDGIEGTPGQDGQNGTDGAPGKDGAPGRDGADGKPPSGWTWTDSAGRTQSCTRDPGSPDTAPTYTCTAPSDGPPPLRIGG